MTRAEQLHWWRQGYQAGLAAGHRERSEHGIAQHRNAVADFRAHREADRQAATNALLLEAIDVLAKALNEQHVLDVLARSMRESTEPRSHAESSARNLSARRSR